MQPLFREIPALDRAARERYGLSEALMMENAARSMAEIIKARFSASSEVLILAGRGNNGADGIALARILHGEYRVRLWLPLGVGEGLNALQLERAQKAGVPVVESLEGAEVEGGDVVVDCLFGSGLSRALNSASGAIIERMNAMRGFKIACDRPSGIDAKGNPAPLAFRADLTCAMGALPLALCSDHAKGYIGEVMIGELGISRALYERGAKEAGYLLEASDFRAPHRFKLDSHKGDYGHAAIITGEKEGAGVIAGLAALRYGAGLVSLVGEVKNLPCELMNSKTIPAKTTAIACGMGLGEGAIPKEAYHLPLVLDADALYREEVAGILEANPCVILTPHPKEFSALLERLGIARVSVEELQADRFALARKFSARFPRAVLLLKGANPIITQGEKLYINPLGSARLAKGGSGDVLSGILVALLAQGYAPLEAAIQGSLAHTLAAQATKGADYALTPLRLIEALGELG